jgi:hypothetical protein
MPRRCRYVPPKPVPTALTKNNTAATRIAHNRPNRSATRPATIAPTAARNNADATANPSVPAPY